MAERVQLTDHLLLFFHRDAPVEASDRLLVAFSGGPDSTALAWGLTRIAGRLGVDVAAVHVDHALDPGSAARARHAARLARALELPLEVERRDVRALRRSGEGLEAAARRVRYGVLARHARRLGARYVATAHHRDDQAETVLLRLLQGSGIAGLAAIRPRRGRLVRPLLGLPSEELAAAVASAGLSPASDPTNDDLSVPRNRVRRRVRPRLEREEPDLGARLARLAAAADGATRRIESRLERLLAPRPARGGLAVERRGLAALPPALRPFSLALLHRCAGADYPPPARAADELFRQLGGGGRVGCDCGDGWRWRSRGDELRLERSRRERPPAPFAYRLPLPGRIEVAELGLCFRIAPSAAEKWMFRGAPRKTGLTLPDGVGPLRVRSRRPGDRIQPLGCRHVRRLKQVLIDRRVPRRERPRLPLLAAGDRVLWVPGVTLDESCRIDRNRRVWTAEIEVS